MTVTAETLMNIHVNRIPADGYQDTAIYDPTTLDVSRFDIRFEQPIEVSVFITKTDRDVLVRANIGGVATLGCARCLALFETRLEADAMLSYRVAPTAVLDITDDLRQELILAYPMIPLCRPDCKGLCPVCGENLNTATCAHAVKLGTLQKGS